MSTKIEHGLGDSLSVTTTAQLVTLNASTGNSDWADEIEFWNTGATDVRIQFNLASTDDFTVASAGIIPAGEKSTRFNLRNPIKTFVVATEADSSTIKYFAS